MRRMRNWFVTKRWILFSLYCEIYKGAVQQRGNDPVVPRVVSIMSFKFEFGF